jgi:hypothetical protein
MVTHGQLRHKLNYFFILQKSLTLKLEIFKILDCKKSGIVACLIEISTRAQVHGIRVTPVGAKHRPDFSKSPWLRALPSLNTLVLIPLYLGQFDANYIIFRNVEIFKNYFFQIKKIL